MSIDRTGSERITFSFPKKLISQLRKRAGKGNMSQYVADSVRKRIEFEEKIKLERTLIEGYQARSALHQKLASEFNASEDEAFEKFLLNDQAQRKG